MPTDQARRSLLAPASPPIAFAAGTRPEWLKLASTMQRLHDEDPHSLVVLDIQQQPKLVRPLLAHYGLGRLRRLPLSSGGPGLADRLSTTTTAVSGALEHLSCAAVVVQGDTTSALAAAVAAFYARIPVVHVEAGLRSGDLAAPFPEEAHRAMITQIATWHVPTSPEAVRRLAALGVATERMLESRNPLFDLMPAKFEAATPEPARRTVLVTMHRRENHERGIPALCAALRELAVADPTLDIVVVAHPHPVVRRGLEAHLGEGAAVRVVSPLQHRTFLTRLAHARLVLTDSGGVQEEAAWLGRDTLLLRRTPDRPDGLAEGRTLVCESERSTIVEKARQLVTREERPVVACPPAVPASEAIVALLRREFIAPRIAAS